MTLSDLAAEVEAEEAQARAEVEKLLEPYRDSQDAANLYGKMAGEYGATLKQWLQLNPDEALTDDKGFKGYLTEASLPGRSYDLVAIIEGNPSLFARLVSCRALQIDHDVAVAQGLESEIKRYLKPRGKTTRLHVDRP